MPRTLAFSSALLVALALLGTAVFAQDLGHLVGKWDIELEFNGNQVQALLELERSDEGLSGTWTGPRGGSSDLELIASDGKTVSFMRKVERGGQTFEIHYSATVDQHDMKGTMKTPRGENPFTGKKR